MKISSSFEHRSASRSARESGVQQMPEYQHFSENRSAFRRGERGFAVEKPLLSCQVLVDPVSHLMGKDHDVPVLSGEIDKHVWVRGGDGGMGERAASLSGHDGSMDPSALEKLRAIRDISGENPAKAESTASFASSQEYTLSPRPGTGA